jgi:hypothetical protein
MPEQPAAEPELPTELREALHTRGITSCDEVALRRQLEARVPGYSLYRLTPAAARRWTCRYRIMLDAGYYDGATPVEVYARALLAVIPMAGEEPQPGGAPQGT